MKQKPKVGDLVRREHTPHIGIITRTFGVDVTVQWLRPFWVMEERVKYSTFPRTDAVMVSRA